MLSSFDKAYYLIFSSLVILGLSACSTDRMMNRSTMFSPSFETETMTVEDVLRQGNGVVAGLIPPESGSIIAGHNKKRCIFSSFQRNDTLGYEIDANRRISFRINPDIDISDLGDSDVEFSLRYTMHFGPAPKKRPCTFGNGYYGLLPYMHHNPTFLDQLTEIETIKAMIEENLD